MFAEANTLKFVAPDPTLFGMAAAGQGPIHVTEHALERARVAQARLLAIRDTEHAEFELRNVAIVEAYEAGAGTRQIARALGMSSATVNQVLAGR